MQDSISDDTTYNIPFLVSRKRWMSLLSGLTFLLFCLVACQSLPGHHSTMIEFEKRQIDRNPSPIPLSPAESIKKIQLKNETAMPALMEKMWLHLTLSKDLVKT